MPAGEGDEAFVESADRSLLTLLPECLEDCVADDNAAHVIEAFVETLDLYAIGFARVAAKETGRPSHHPSVLLSSTSTAVSIGFKRADGWNAMPDAIEVMWLWLTGRLAPDHKTMGANGGQAC